MAPNEPMIHTSHGNLSIAALVYAVRWEDAEEYLKFVETYSLDGEVVRESAHVYAKRGLLVEPAAGSF